MSQVIGLLDIIDPPAVHDFEDVYVTCVTHSLFRAHSDVMRCHVMWCHVMWCHMMCCHVMRCHVYVRNSLFRLLLTSCIVT